MKTQHRHFWFLFVALVLGGAVINFWERTGEAHAARRPLKEFPSSLGDWRQYGGDVRFDAESEAVLKATDYVMRDYLLPDGQSANFYIGYYATQRGGATYHSPLNCLPGSGWELNQPAVIQITPSGGTPFEANRYLIENGSDKFMLIYWYQGRGRAVASEYWDKVYTIFDSVRRRRSDGAMVRVMVPVKKSETEALRTATSLASIAASRLPEFVPE